MTTEEKLNHFLETCTEDAQTRGDRMLAEYQAALEKTFQEHQTDARRHAKMQLRLETEKIEREMNKQLSIAQIEFKRNLGKKQDDLKDKLFVELRDHLANYLESQEYVDLLDAQIRHALEFAGEDEVVIYLDPVDEEKLHELSRRNSKAMIRVSEYSFTGGTRAVIVARHILIDNSFQTKLTEAKENFHFDLDLKAGGMD